MTGYAIDSDPCQALRTSTSPNSSGSSSVLSEQNRSQQLRQLTQWRWHLDEVFVKINGETHYLWRAVDHEGEVLESYVTKTRDKAAALKFLKKAMKNYGRPVEIVTDGLKSYGAAMNEIGNIHRQEVGRHLNNRAENSHLPLRATRTGNVPVQANVEPAEVRGTVAEGRVSPKNASTHASFYNHVNLDRHINRRQTFKTLRDAALLDWRGLLAA